MSTCPLMSALQPELEKVALTSINVIAALSQGLSNQNYYIRAQRHNSRHHEWVLRVNSQASSQLCNRENEVTNWRLAAAQGLAPSLTFVAKDLSCYLSEFIEQDSLDWASMARAQGAHPLTTEHVCHSDAEALLLSLLTSLQSLPLPKNSISMTAQWQHYYGVLMSRFATMSKWQQTHANDCLHTEKLNRLSEKWLADFESLMANKTVINEWLVQVEGCLLNNQFCHRDLNPHNLLLNRQQLFAIDYEYACASHPLWDLAGILATHHLSSNQRQYLIRGYIANNPNLTQGALQAAPSSIYLYWVFSACWALLMAFSFLEDERKAEGDKSHSNQDALKAEEYLDCFKQFMHFVSS
ncbi:phosphotransferase [uncultured Shewanella sp.]|uniref:phosphotransferase n=1 Tax=uncultured Shewanella sp. TaxID=173975 RepID=UPI0026142085|nr:phosphotransferase [uncultured Shewanella sp.]